MHVKKALVLSSLVMSLLSVSLPAFSGACDVVYSTLNVVTADTGSRVSGSGGAFAMSASYSSSTSVEVKGSFYKTPAAGNGNLLTFMIANIGGVLYANNGASWQTWDGNIDTLSTYSSIPDTTAEISLPINNGPLSAGSYQISFGYKQLVDLPKGNCFEGYYYFYNGTPISISVN